MDSRDRSTAPPPAVLDHAYNAVARSLVPLTRALVNATASICGVARDSPESFIVWVSRPESLSERYGIRFLLTPEEGRITTTQYVVATIRAAERVDLHHAAQQSESYPRGLLGTPVYEAATLPGDSADNSAGSPTDGLFYSAWSTFKLGETEGDGELRAVGFIQLEPEWIRFYVDHRERTKVLAVDVPTYASGDLYGELAAILRTSNSAAIEGLRGAPDPLCSERFDLRPWFGR